MSNFSDQPPSYSTVMGGPDNRRDHNHKYSAATAPQLEEAVRLQPPYPIISQMPMPQPTAYPPVESYDPPPLGYPPPPPGAFGYPLIQTPSSMPLPHVSYNPQQTPMMPYPPQQQQAYPQKQPVYPQEHTVVGQYPGAPSSYVAPPPIIHHMQPITTTYANNHNTCSILIAGIVAIFIIIQIVIFSLTKVSLAGASSDVFAD